MVEKIRNLEEKAKALAEKNAELQRREAEMFSKESFDEQLILNSKTFGLLLEQAEQMAQDYDDLKEKHAALEAKYRDVCIKHELELKDLWTREKDSLEKVIEQVSVLAAQQKEEAKEEVENEVERHYKRTVELKHGQIAKLEEELLQMERQIGILKQDRKVVDGSEKAVQEILKKEMKDSEKIKKLAELLQQKIGEVVSERQMQDMWISELEVATKAYEQERTYGKTVAKEVTSLHHP
eukprot:TRINITY_DN9596_c0_g1_i10.p2 TRINITY_DN9596_c0_g1~~TRINITY_DN9596_c0_g1_i10.p2  ORF type:complete len:238 (-),score=115.58 TRINITY_DN9596_c0_g1_i10:706-1419(-)